MLEIEIINACLAPNGSKDSARLLNGIDSYCIVKMFGKEIARTQISMGSFDPIWTEKFPKALHELISKEVVYNRPFYLENIEIEVYDASKSLGDKHVKLFETRVPISHIGMFMSYRLLKCSGSGESNDENRIFVRITRTNNQIYDKVDSFTYQTLSNVCPIHCSMYRHLYMDFSWSPNAFTYSSGLPGPTTGELIVDRYCCVEWRVATGTNVFGDKISISCTGQLIITDLRVIFIPHEVHSPSLTWGVDSVTLQEIAHFDDTNSRMSASDILTVHRYTFQLPLSALLECRTYLQSPSTTSSTSNTASSGLPGVPNMPTMSGISAAVASGAQLLNPPEASTAPSAAAWVLSLDASDGSTTEFIVKKHHGHRSHRKQALGFDQLHTAMIRNNISKLDSPVYRAGLDTADIDPQVWCERVLDYLQWEIKLDMVWVRWAKYLKLTGAAFTSQATKSWLKKCTNPIDLDVDFQRLRVQDMDWRLSDLNSNYNLCATYPSVLVFPGAVQDEDILGASADRSINRLPALVWLHPDTKAPLCRAAQPMSGMSGNSIEQDKKMCVAIKQSCPTGLPLRIADARPKLNANANAMQGKGFENVTFLGGPSVASIAFLDIDNIHVVRHSLAKLRESLHTGSSGAADSNPSSSTVNPADGSTVHASKWTGHIGSILRGAAGVADSLMLGHPVLVHCSDGWDRTSQLTALAQLMIDPFYRTVEGFLILLQKEWCSFGHKFEDRLGCRKGHSKEVSPVCLQYLDCVWQLQRQFPTNFEFSGHFCTFLSQAIYSGLFINFRRNSERERLQMMRQVGPYEDMQNDDFDFSTLSSYAQMLLRTSNYSALLLNPYYTPPKLSQKYVHYLRPCYGLHDLELWKDGLCGLNNNVHSASSMTVPSVTFAEATAVHRDLHHRYWGYIELHQRHLPVHVQTKLDLIKCSDYPAYASELLCLTNTGSTGAAAPTTATGTGASTGSNSGKGSAAEESAPGSTPAAQLLSLSEARLMRSIYPHSAVLNPTSNVTKPLATYWRHEDYDASFHDILDSYKATEACKRIQVWGRAVLVARRALKILESYIEEKELTPPAHVALGNKVEEDGWVKKRKAQLRKSIVDNGPKRYFRTFYVLSSSQIRTSLREKEQLQQTRAAFARSIIDDALEQAMIYCIRNDNYRVAYAYRRSAVADYNEYRASADLSKGSDNKKSLTSRIFGGFTTSSGSAKESSPAGSTNSASMSAAAVAAAAAAEQGTSPNNRASGRFDANRSISPKPTLMGRLLGSNISK